MYHYIAAMATDKQPSPRRMCAWKRHSLHTVQRHGRRRTSSLPAVASQTVQHIGVESSGAMVALLSLSVVLDLIYGVYCGDREVVSHAATTSVFFFMLIKLRYIDR
jgi:hypothetical protein